VLELRRESSLKTQVTSITLRKHLTSISPKKLLSHPSLHRERDSKAMSTREWKEASSFLEVNTLTALAAQTPTVLKPNLSTTDL